MTFLSPTKTASPFIPLSPSPFVHPSSNLCFIFLRFDEFCCEIWKPFYGDSCSNEDDAVVRDL